MSCCGKGKRKLTGTDILNEIETAGDGPVGVFITADGEKHKHRNLTEEKDLLKRLNRIEGQVRGVKAMVEDERYCVDILNQVSAIQAALSGFSRVLLSNHIKTCVVDDIEAGNGDEAVDELCRTIQKMLK